MNPFTQNGYSLELTERMTGKPRTKFPMWLLEEHRCPVCHKAVTDLLLIAFMESEGMCDRCEAALNSIGYDKEVLE